MREKGLILILLSIGVATFLYGLINWKTEEEIRKEIYSGYLEMIEDIMNSAGKLYG